MKMFKLFKRTHKIKDEDLLKLVKIEYKDDYIFAYNQMKQNPTKSLEVGDMK